MKKKKIKNLFSYAIVIIIIIFLKNLFNYKINIDTKIELIISYIKSQKESKRNENYFKYIRTNFTFLEKYKRLKKPKVSVISPIYNREKYISKFLKIIQSQTFNNIEIVLVDDCSKDNSVELIEEYQKINERILLIKNNVNKGTFVSRNIGALYSNSKYLIFPDPDDILDKNIISLCFKLSEKYNYEMIRFNIFRIDESRAYSVYLQKEEEISVKQPELSRYMFYGNNELFIIDYYIHNKFIKKDLYVKTVNSLNKFMNMYITLWEDSIISFILYRNAESFCSLRRIGYFYIKNSQSITKIMYKISDLKLEFIFIFLSFVFTNTKNTKYEKDMFNLLFTQMNYEFNIRYRLFDLSKKKYAYIYENIKIYLKCSFITEENRNILKDFISIIEYKFKPKKKK